MRAHAGEFLQGRHHVERLGIAVGIFSLRQRARLLALRAAGDEGEQFEQRIRRRRQRHLRCQHLAQRLASDFGGVRCAKQGNDLIDMAELVAGEDAEGIADDIIEAAAREVEIDVPGFLFRAGLVEETARQERGRHRIVARSAGLRGDGRRRCDGRGRRPGRCGRGLLQFLMQRLQHPRGFLAAGDAEIEPRLRLAGDRLGIVVAIVAALAAILLRHRRHHPPSHRAAFGEFHAVGDRHGLVVPGRFAVVAIAGGTLQHSGALLG